MLQKESRILHVLLQIQFTCNEVLLLLLLFKKVGSARLRDSDITPYQSEDPSPTIPTYI